MLAIEPTDSTQASEPAEPMDRIEPAEPIDKMDPLDPMDRIDPLEPMLRIDPDEPAEREEPLLIPMRPLCRNDRLRQDVAAVNAVSPPIAARTQANSLGGTQGTWHEHHDPFGEKKGFEHD
jgi:hypothetical protein